MNLSPDDTAMQIGGIATTGLGLLLWLRSFLSKQKLELQKNDAETNVVKLLQDERDKAVASAEKAWESRTQDAQRIGELTAKVEAQTHIIEHLTTQVTTLTQSIEILRKENHKVRNEMQTMVIRMEETIRGSH